LPCFASIPPIPKAVSDNAVIELLENLFTEKNLSASAPEPDNQQNTKNDEYASDCRGRRFDSGCN
jgi:hypothetical protein